MTNKSINLGGYKIVDDDDRVILKHEDTETVWSFALDPGQDPNRVLRAVDTVENNSSVYASSDPGESRVTQEGQIEVNEGETRVEFPEHFTEAVSEEDPQIRVQVTPSDLATVAVPLESRSSEGLSIKSSEDTTVDYHVSARSGTMYNE